MTTIPASQLVSVVPSVLAAGGSALDIIGLFLTTNTRAPIGAVPSFPNASAVNSYFGATSDEATAAAIYFAGYDGATKLPAALLFAQLPTAAVGAYIRGGDITVSLATLQGYNGILALSIDGALKSANINLASATSFSNAASIIGNALGIQGPSVGSITGSIGGTTLNVTSIISGGPLAAGQVISGTGVTAGTYIVAQLSGTAGLTGTYQVSPSQTAGLQTISLFSAGASYDSQSGGFIIISATTGNSSTVTYGSGALATNLLLTLATGAVLSQGTVGVTATTGIAAFMNGVTAVTTDWVTFMTMFDPDVALSTGSNTAKQAFAAWKSTQNNRYAYICDDPDLSPTVSVPAPASLGNILENAEDSGTFIISENISGNIDAFVCGAAASINFAETNGRITFAYKWQSGLTATVTSATIAQNLIANSYNFGGAYGAANQNFVWLQNGQVTGPFEWLDSYINQIWLNNAFQVALLTLLKNAPSIPYDPAGQGLIEQALADPIAAGLNFGAFAPGAISASQAAQVNGAAGAQVSDSLQAQGYYLQVLPASATVRAARQSPPVNFWYLDRGSIQMITMASIAVQ